MGRRNRRRRRRREFELEDLFDLDDFFEKRDYDWDDWGKFRKRVIVDSSRRPEAGFPIGIGIFLLFFAPFLIQALPFFIPLVGVLLLFAGIAAFATRVAWGFRKLATRTFRKFFESKQKRQQRLLKELEQRLKGDGEPRTEHLLRKLSGLYETLQKDIANGTLTIVAKDVLASVDQMNKLCIENLDESHRLWVEAQKSPPIRDVRLKQREALIQEVTQSVQHLEGIVSQLHQQSLNRNRNELRRLREELDETLEVAKRVEERTEELVTPSEKAFEVE